MRIVRNQDNFPETAEDGVIIFDKFGAIDDVAIDDVNYSSNYPAFSSGRYSYYRAWLRKQNNSWHPAGDSYVLVPSEHSTKTSRNTTRSSIEEGVSHKVISARVSGGVATLTTEMDVTTSSTDFEFPGSIRVGSIVRIYGLPVPYQGVFTVTSIGSYTFSFNVSSGNLSATEVSGVVRAYPDESSMEENQSQSEYSDVELLTTHEKFMDLLPKVYTSQSESPLDAVDANSDLYRFIEAFSMTIDEAMTFADLLKPQYSGASASPTTMGLAANMYGLTPESTFAAKSQKRMVREASYIYANKGTQGATETLVESITGFAPRVTTSENLFLSVQDSSFYTDVGFWQAYGGATLSAVNMTTTYPSISVPKVSAPNAIDLDWAGKVVVGTANAYISSSNNSIFTKGIPVKEGTQYTFSYYAYGTGTVKAYITWYNQLGQVISTVNGSTVTLAGAWVKDATATFTAPVGNGTSPVYGASYASVKLVFASTGTYYVDMLSFANSVVTDYEEARATNIFIYPSKYNFLNNPSFEGWTGTAFNNWTTSGGTVARVTTDLNLSYGESYMMAFDSNPGAISISSSTNAGIAFSNNFYTFSVYARTSAATETVRLTIGVNDGVITPITHTSDPFVLTTSWQRIQMTIKVPAKINSISAVLTTTISGTALGNVINFDNAQLEMSYTATDYCDGYLGYLNGFFWQGTANASPSFSYPNLTSKIERLVAEIPNYLPRNKPYTISTAYRTERRAIT
jgi:hypothetical protein